MPSLERAALKHSASPVTVHLRTAAGLSRGAPVGGLFSGGLQQRLSLGASARMTLQRRGEEAGTFLHSDSVRSTFPPTALGLLSPPSPGQSTAGAFAYCTPSRERLRPLTPPLTLGPSSVPLPGGTWTGCGWRLLWFSLLRVFHCSSWRRLHGFLHFGSLSKAAPLTSGSSAVSSSAELLTLVGF